MLSIGNPLAERPSENNGSLVWPGVRSHESDRTGPGPSPSQAKFILALVTYTRKWKPRGHIKSSEKGPIRSCYLALADTRPLKRNYRRFGDGNSRHAFRLVGLGHPGSYPSSSAQSPPAARVSSVRPPQKAELSKVDDEDTKPRDPFRFLGSEILWDSPLH